jgi:hypothetical protein
MAIQIVNLQGRLAVDTIAVTPTLRGRRTLKLSSPLFSAVAFAALALTAAAQTHEPQRPKASGAAEHHHHDEPAPTNLKVLPKNMTGEQVHELMHKWEAELGAECTTCHAADPNKKMPNGRPALNFADDSKPEKNTARLMYRMMVDINKNYVSKVEQTSKTDNAEAMVTCGTCHRGHVDPTVYVPPKHDHDHDHPAPGGESKP